MFEKNKNKLDNIKKDSLNMIDKVINGKKSIKSIDPIVYVNHHPEKSYYYPQDYVFPNINLLFEKTKYNWDNGRLNVSKYKENGTFIKYVPSPSITLPSSSNS